MSIAISPLYRGPWPCLFYGLNLLYFLSNSCSSEKVDRPRLWIPGVCHLRRSVSVRPVSPSRDRNPRANWHKQQGEFTSLQSGMAGSRSPDLIVSSFSPVPLSQCVSRQTSIERGPQHPQANIIPRASCLRKRVSSSQSSSTYLISSGWMGFRLLSWEK